METSLFRGAARDEVATRQKLWRLAFSVSLVAGALGTSVSIISVIARAKFWETPQHPPLGEGIYLGVVGFLAGLLAIAALLKLVGVDAYRPRSILIWLLVGLIYGVTLSFVTGALLPPSTVLVATASGQSSLTALIPNLLDSIFAMPWAALTQGFLGLPPSLLAGALLALVAWSIDCSACSENRTLSAYGTVGIALVVAVSVLAFTVFSPAWLLSLVGWGPS